MSQLTTETSISDVHWAELVCLLCPITGVKDLEVCVCGLRLRHRLYWISVEVSVLRTGVLVFDAHSWRRTSLLVPLKRSKVSVSCAQWLGWTSLSFSFSFSSRWHHSTRKGPYALRPVSQQSPQGCHWNSANICLVEHRSFSTLEGGMSAASFLHSSFFQAINAVMLWLVRVEKVPQAPLPCQAAVQMWYLLCLPVYLPVHSHWLRRAQDSRSTEFFVAEDCTWLCASRGSPFQTPPIAGGSLSLWEWWHGRFSEFVRMMNLAEGVWSLREVCSVCQKS